MNKLFVCMHARIYVYQILKYKGIFTNKEQKLLVCGIYIYICTCCRHHIHMWQRSMDYIDLFVFLYHSLNFIFQFNYWGGLGEGTDRHKDCICMQVPMGRGKGVLDYFKLELQEVMSHQMWVL